MQTIPFSHRNVPIQTYLPPSPTKFPANTLPFLIRTFQHRLYNGSYIFPRRVGSPLCVNQACGKLRARQKSGKFGECRPRSRNFSNSKNRFENSNTDGTAWLRISSAVVGRDRFSRVESIATDYYRTDTKSNLLDLEQILLYFLF